MTKELKCPVCGGDIEIDDIIDSVYISNDMYKEFGYGCCEKCGRDYDVNRIYVVKEYEIIEVKDD